MGYNGEPGYQWPGLRDESEGVVTRDKRCVVIPVSLAGLVALWGAAALLIGWNTVGGPDAVGKWGLLCSAGAASWTVIYGLARQYELMAEAFRLGRESVSPIRRT